MASSIQVLTPLDTGSAAETGLRFTTRQPLLDARGTVHAYALMFRNGLEEALRGEEETAVSTAVDTSIVYGFDRLTGGLPAFVSCTDASLRSGVVHQMPARATILEIQETAQPAPDLIATCHLLKAAGFRLAFGNYCWESRFEPFLRLADYIRVDCALLRRMRPGMLRERSKSSAVRWVAKNVETQEEFHLAREEGFTLFQGYYFCHPELLKIHSISANQVAQIQVLSYLQGKAVDMHALSRLVMKDVGLTFRLLRLVNSPLFPLRREVTSVEAALMVAGEEAFRRMVTVALASELNSGGSAELLRMALVRARFCEQTAPLFEQDANEIYLLGMLSLLPAMLKVSMGDVAPGLPLREGIRSALLGASNQERRPLSWLELWERGQWGAGSVAAREAGVDEPPLAEAYVDAVRWAEMAMRFVH
jgi:c-di-GMP-related signal transduction protein